jgi:Tetratricopeptide repeat
MRSAKDARMTPERLNEPPVRRSLVGAGIVALWGALVAALGAPLVGLVLAGIALLVCLGALVAGRRPSLPRPSIPVRSSLRRVPLAPVGRGARRAVALVPPLARRGRESGRLVVARVPPFAERGRAGAATLAERAAPLLGSAVEATGRARGTVLAPIERRRRRGALGKEAWKLNAQGVEHRREGRGAAAVDAHEQAVAIFRQLGDDRSEGLALNNLGLALMTEDDEVGAIDAFERALSLLGRSGDRQSEGRVLANLGTLHRRLDRQEAALLYWRQALTRLDADSPEHERMTELLEIAS